MIELYFWPTPNGHKISIALEEMGLAYQLRAININKGEQFDPAFLAFSPNNRMPAIKDPDGPEGQPVTVFESGAILQYLAEKTGQFMPSDPRGKFNVVQWVMWQMANQGPKTGECGHFRRLGEDAGDQSYAVTRFTDEVNRFYGVLNNQLYQQRYLCGDEYTIADMICYPWTVNWAGQGQDITQFKYFKRWFDELSDRPAVQRGMAAGSDMQNDFSSLSKDEAKALRALLYNQRARPAPETGGIES